MDPAIFFIPVVLAIVVLTLFVATMRAKARERAHALAAGDDPEITFSTESQDRRVQGACRYCAERAEHRTPRIIHERVLFDGFLRRLGVVPTAKFRLEVVNSNLDASVDLCRRHFSRARTLLECELGKVPAQYARFTDEITRELIDFEAIGLREKMETDAVASTRRKRRGAQPAAQVVELPRRSGT